RGLLDLGLRAGPYGSSWRLWKQGLTLRQLERAPHGIDLGPLAPCLPERLQTPGRRIQLAPQLLRNDLERLTTRYPLDGATTSGQADRRARIGRRNLLSNTSRMHNSERLVKGKPRCPLLMHPADGSARGITDGQPVRVTSRVGSVEAPVELSEEVMRGV